MTEKPRQAQVTDDYDRPVPGAEIYVTDTLTLGNAVLTVDGTVPLAQPVVTDEFGIYTYWANEGFYREDIYYGGKLRYREMTAVGVPPQFKGDPGGNVMAIGLFVAGPSLTIPAGADLVRTSGYTAKGIGAADYIYDAAVDAAYVTANPRTSFVSSNGRGYRLDVSKGIDLQQVGGVADTTAFIGTAFNGTDNYAALVAARDALGNGGLLRIPQGSGAYRSSAKVTFTKGIRIAGDGWHQNPGLVNGVTYVGIQQFPGSVLCFDQDVAGLQFIAYTDNNADSTAFEYQSSVYSNLENLMLYGGGGTSTSAHGLETRTILFATNVRVEDFAGNGVQIMAWTGAITHLYGLADHSMLRSVHSNANGCHGFYTQGNDANVITFLGCNASENGGVGFLDVSFLGNQYFGCKAATNNASFGSAGAQRAFVISDAGGVDVQTGWSGLSDALAGSYVTTRVVGAHTFCGCYTENQKAHIIRPSVIIGGNLTSSGNRTADSDATVIGAVNELEGTPGGTRIRSQGGISQLIIETPDASYANLQLKSNGATVLDVLASAGVTFLKCDNFDFYKADGVTSLATIDANGLSLGGLQLVGHRGAAVTAPAGGVTVDTQARTAITDLINRLQIHGLIS